jgi:hypothetical protein
MWIKKPMVLIEWHDAKFFPGTHREEAIQDNRMALFKSLGYLIAQNDTTTTLAAEQNDQGEYRDITLIPSGSVISIHELLPRSFVQFVMFFLG